MTTMAPSSSNWSMPSPKQENKLAIITYVPNHIIEQLKFFMGQFDEVDKDYDFFDHEDKCVDNNYSLDRLQEETKKMEEDDEEFKQLFEMAVKAKLVVN